MENLEWHTLSIILSFLEETEGTSFMLTKKRYTNLLLPAFRIKPDTDPLDLLSVNGSKPIKHRHKFVVIPVQDPAVLLARLNTKRLFRRKQRPCPHATCQDIATSEWQSMHPNDVTLATIWRPPSLELLRFLDKKSELSNIPTTIIVSYPRSGNTLIRTLLERITGHVTGSDTRPDRNLSKELAERHDLVGEGVTQSSKVRIVKTHWPERNGNTKYTAKRAVLVVRNPYDAIDSYWNMNATCSHTKTLTEDVYDRFREKFEKLVRNEIAIWMKFHEYWIHRSPVPVFVVRYEDLVQNAESEMMRVLQFILDAPTLSPYWIQRIRHVTGASSVHQLGSYQPRSGTNVSIGKSLRKGHISNELVQYIHEYCAMGYASNYLYDFGYDIILNRKVPENFADPAKESPSLPAHIISSVNRSGSVRVNGTPSIRPAVCEFGRLLQKWRHSVTNNDQDPLPTVAS